MLRETSDILILLREIREYYFRQRRSSTSEKMPFKNDDYLPSYEELTVPELQVTSSVLRAGAHHFGKYCDEQSKVGTSLFV